MESATNQKSDNSGWLTDRSRWLIVGLLLFVFAILCVTSAQNESATYDETHYLGAGYHWLKTHRRDTVDSILHPVFWTMWHDLPLLAEDVPKPVIEELDGTSSGNHLLALHADDSVLNHCRLMLLPFGLGLGLVVYLWSAKLYGSAGGLVSLVFLFLPQFAGACGFDDS